MPFGLEQNTGVTEIDFAYRTLGSTKIAPGRDTGVMAYGELLGGSLAYEAGVFDDDGDNGELEGVSVRRRGPGLEDLEDVGPSVAVRVVGDLFRGLPVHDRLKGAKFGIAYTNANVPEGLNSLQGEEVWGYRFLRAGLREGPPPAAGPAVRLDARAARVQGGMDAVARSNASARATATKISPTSSAPAGT